jgi:glycerate kinase
MLTQPDDTMFPVPPTEFDERREVVRHQPDTGVGTGRRTVLVCPDSFKGTLTAVEATEAIARGVLAAWPEAEVLKCPLADGGEGTLDAMLSHGGERRSLLVEGPDGSRVMASWGVLPGNIAVIESAQASGLTLVPPDKRDPRTATSHGTGRLIREAIKSGCDPIFVGIGGTATNDGGMGAMRALGARFLDGEGNELERGGAALIRLDRIDLSDFAVPDIGIIVASDVTNKLCGEEGATRVFAPQKGATPEMVEELEAAMQNYAQVLQETFGEDVASRPGAGAAGGLGAALLSFLHGTFLPGADVVMMHVRFLELVERADLIITGEGKLDSQSLGGKLISRVISHAQGKPIILLCGALDLGDADCLRLVASNVIGMHYGNESGLDSLKQPAEALERLAVLALQRM